MDNKETTLIEFPCDFPIKVIGKNTPNFYDEILDIAKRSDPMLNTERARQTLSKQGHYISVHLLVYATSQIQLDTLYQELIKHPDISMVL